MASVVGNQHIDMCSHVIHPRTDNDTHHIPIRTLVHILALAPSPTERAPRAASKSSPAAGRDPAQLLPDDGPWDDDLRAELVHVHRGGEMASLSVLSSQALAAL